MDHFISFTQIPFHIPFVNISFVNESRLPENNYNELACLYVQHVQYGFHELKLKILIIFPVVLFFICTLLFNQNQNLDDISVVREFDEANWTSRWFKQSKLGYVIIFISLCRLCVLTDYCFTI